MEYPIFNTSVNGTFEHNTAGEVEKEADWLFVSAAAVISRIEINGATAVNAVTDYIDTPASAVGAGTYLAAGFGNFFSAVTLTSGSVTFILRNT